jgi:hypothetical protein
LVRDLKALHERSLRSKDYVGAFQALSELYFLGAEEQGEEAANSLREAALLALAEIPDLGQVRARLKQAVDQCWRILTIGTKVLYEEYVLVLSNLAECDLAAQLLAIVGVEAELDLDALMPVLAQSVALPSNRRPFRSALAALERHSPHLSRRSPRLAAARLLAPV